MYFINCSESQQANENMEIFPQGRQSEQLLRNTTVRKLSLCPKGLSCGSFYALQVLELFCAPRGPQDRNTLGICKPWQPRLHCGCHLGLMQPSSALKPTFRLLVESCVDSFSILKTLSPHPLSGFLFCFQNELFIPLLEIGLPQFNCLEISNIISSPQ